MSHNQKRAAMEPQPPDTSADEVVERFPSTNGRLTAVIFLAVAAVILVLAIKPLSAGTPLGVAIVTCFCALLIWVVMLRPAVRVTTHDLVFRNMLVTLRIPLAAIDRIVITQVLAVSVGGKRYVSPAIGYTLRQTVRSRRPGAPQPDRMVISTAQVFVEERLRHYVDEARLRREPVGRVRRTPAWLELAGLAFFAAAFIVWFVAVR